MFGFLKNLLRKSAAAPVENHDVAPLEQDPESEPMVAPQPPRAVAPRQNGRPSASGFAPAASRAGGNPAQPAMAAPGQAPAARTVQIPLQPVLESLPLELQPRVVEQQVGEMTISIGIEKVLSQLSRGSVRITFGELRAAAPGVFSAEADRDRVAVPLPLNEILSRLNPALIARRRVQKQIEVPSDISSPFDPANAGAIYHIGPSKPPQRPAPQAQPQPQPQAPAPAPAPQRAITPTPAPQRPAAPQVHQLPQRPTITSAPTPPPPAAPSIPTPSIPFAPRPGADLRSKPQTPAQTPPSDIPDIFSSPIKMSPQKPLTAPSSPSFAAGPSAPANQAPAPARPAPSTPSYPAGPVFPKAPSAPQFQQHAPVQSTPSVIPFGMAPATPAPLPAHTPAPAAPAAPRANFGSKPLPEVETLLVPLASLAEAWPEPIRKEIVQMNLVEAKLALPVEVISQALKQGRIALPWKHIRGWMKGAVSPVASPNDNVVVELPLQIVAPLFLARQKAASADKQKVNIDAEIPNLFFGFPQAEAAAATAVTKPVDTNYYVWDDKSDTAHITPEEVQRPSIETRFATKCATPNEVVSRAAALEGVAGALIALPDGLMVANRLSADLNGETLAAFLPQIFSKVTQCTKELRMGELNNLNFTVGNVPWKIFRVNAIFFAAFGRAGQGLPTAQLTALAAELDHKPK